MKSQQGTGVAQPGLPGLVGSQAQLPTHSVQNSIPKTEQKNSPRYPHHNYLIFVHLYYCMVPVPHLLIVWFGQ